MATGISSWSPGQDERCPTFEYGSICEREPLHAIGGERRIGLRRQQSRQDDKTARRRKPRQRRGKPLERLQQDIGDHEVVRRAGAEPPVANSIRSDHTDEPARPVRARVLSRGRDGGPIDVARERRTAAGPGGRDRKHTAAGADIENAARPPCFEQMINREQTSARRAVMPGAERQRRFYFDADAVDADASTVMASVHDEATHPNRLECREACCNPITVCKGFECERVTGGFAEKVRDKVANSCLIRGRMKIYGDRPITIGRLGSRHHHIPMIKFLNEKVTQPMCYRFTRTQSGNNGRSENMSATHSAACIESTDGDTKATM